MPSYADMQRVRLCMHALCLCCTDALRRIAREEGLRGLWSGTLPSLLLVSNPAIQFMVYEALKRQVFSGADKRLTVRHGGQLKPLLLFLSFRSFLHHSGVVMWLSFHENISLVSSYVAGIYK